MPTHDIIDNRQEKLVDNVNRILSSTEAARFAVGYFFLSGLEPIAAKLAGVKELRLLIGNTTNRETIEQIAEGRHRLELVADRLEAETFPKRTESRKMAEATADYVCRGMELMDQTDEGEALVKSLAQMIEEKRVKVKVFTKGRLHAKAYIFDYGTVYDAKGKPVDRQEKGLAVVGSSNLTLAGISHNTELNVLVHGNQNHEQLVKWFDELWAESEEFDEALMQELKQSWAAAPATPYDIYMKTLYELVRDRIEAGEDTDILWDDEITNKLADFQKTAVKQAVQMLRRYGGAFVADVVGLGKSYIGAAIVKHFARTERCRPLIICPAALVDMWKRYNSVYDLNAEVLSMGLLREEDGGDLALLREDVRYRDRDFVLIDESHNLRHADTQRYKMVQDFLTRSDRYCCFLTATPRNKSAWDVYHQIKLFHPDDRTDLPIDPPDLRKYFRLVEKGERKLPDLLYHVLVRRLRQHIVRWYGYAADTGKPLKELSEDEARPYLAEPRKAYILVGGRHQYFPRRELDTVEYSIEDTYQGLYRELRGYLGGVRKSGEKPKEQLTYARYGLWHYVKKEKQHREPYVELQRAGSNLRGLIRILLFKRFESSVEAFRLTVGRLLRMQTQFLKSLDDGFVPAGEEAQAILYEPNVAEQQRLLAALRAASGKYHIADFDVERLRTDIKRDVKLLDRILKKVEPITAEKDEKLQVLKKRLAAKPLAGGKRLIFSEFADTAQYLYDNLNPGGKRDDIEVVYSGDKSKARIVGRFAPKANPEFRPKAGESEITTLVATDVLAEGLNLQDCDCVVNYDLHWNPVRLIQRFGRIDRIGSEHQTIYAFNFLPEVGIEKNLGLHEKLRNRIQEIHDTIGEDAKILDDTERLNEEAMFAVYEKHGGQLNLFYEPEDDVVDLNEAEEVLKLLRKDEPQEYERIANLRDGIRSAKTASSPGLFVFCAAGRYQQLSVVDDNGEVVTRDLARVLSAIKSTHSAPVSALPKGHNAAVMRAKAQFAVEARHRESDRKYAVSLSPAQRYVQRELRALYGSSTDDEERARISVLERGFSGALTVAVRSTLNKMRRNAMTGPALLKALTDLYHDHGMAGWVGRAGQELGEGNTPRIVCSEALL
jgi:superfamily II DNA/RNA helicase